MKLEYIVEDACTNALPTDPAAFMQHFKSLFEQIPKGANTPKVDFHDYQGVYSVRYKRVITPEEEEAAMQQARETNRIATAALIAQEKAELKRLKDKYE